MAFHRLLDLPSPLNPNTQDELINRKLSSPQFISTIIDFKKYLSSELLEVLDSLNCTPKFFILFGEGKTPTHNSFVHSDILFHGGKWVDLPFGINWELFPCESNWGWWEPGNNPPVYPASTLPMFNGIHYGSRGNKNTESFKLIENLTMPINQAVLVRTDVIHNIQYTTDSVKGLRVSLSVRFDVDQVPSWEKALELFQPFIK